MPTTCFQVTKRKDKLLGKILPNSRQSASHSDPSSHQTLQSICLSHALLVNQHLFYLRACGAQLAQLAGRRDANSRQHRSDGSGVWQRSQHRGRQCVQRQLCWGLSQSKEHTSGRCTNAKRGKPSWLRSPRGFKVPLQLSSVTAEPCFALRLNLARGLGTEY